MSRKKTEPDVDGGPSDPSHLTVAVNRRIRVSGHPYNSPSLCIRSSLFSHPSPTRFSSLALSVVSHHGASSKPPSLSVLTLLIQNITFVKVASFLYIGVFRVSACGGRLHFWCCWTFYCNDMFYVYTVLFSFSSVISSFLGSQPRGPFREWTLITSALVIVLRRIASRICIRGCQDFSCLIPLRWLSAHQFHRIIN